MASRVKQYIEDEFTKIRELKETARSKVTLASTNTGELVVIKCILQTGLPFRRLKEIAHPLWPCILFIAEEENVTWVVEEYVSGNTLAAVLETGKIFNDAEVRDIMLQLLDGMTAFHQAGIIHRDIKPSNIILQGARQVRLIDFDASRLMHEDDSPDTRALGTSGYAPPEQYGFGQTDARSDIYALGVTMKELLGENCPGRLMPILDKCVELAPKDRYQTAEELRNILLYPRRRQHIMLAAFLFAVCVMIATGYFVRQPKSSNESHENTTQQTETPLQTEIISDSSPQTNEVDSVHAQKAEENQISQDNAPIIPQVALKPAVESKKLSADDIGLSLAVGKKNLGAGGKYNIVVPKSEWDSWEVAETTPMLTKYFPTDWEIVLTVENHGDIKIESFTLEVNREDAKKINCVTPVSPGETAQIAIPMSGYALQRSGDFIWLSFSSEEPRLKSSSFTYSIWIVPETN